MRTNSTTSSNTSSVNSAVLSWGERASQPFLRSIEYKHENTQLIPVTVSFYGTHQNLYFDIYNVAYLIKETFSSSMIMDINSLQLSSAFYTPINRFQGYQNPLCTHFDLINVLANRSYGDIGTGADNIRKFIINFGSVSMHQPVNSTASNNAATVTTNATPESQLVENVSLTKELSINELRSEEHRLKCELADFERKEKIAEAIYDIVKVRVACIEVDGNSSDAVMIPKNRMTNLANLISRDELRKRKCDLAISLNQLKGECAWKLTLELRDLNASIKSNTQQRTIAVAEYELAKAEFKLEHLPRDLEEYQAWQEYSKSQYNIIICKQKLAIVQAKIANQSV